MVFSPNVTWHILLCVTLQLCRRVERMCLSWDEMIYVTAVSEGGANVWGEMCYITSVLEVGADVFEVKCVTLQLRRRVEQMCLMWNVLHYICVGADVFDVKCVTLQLHRRVERMCLRWRISSAVPTWLSLHNSTSRWPSVETSTASLLSGQVRHSQCT